MADQSVFNLNMAINIEGLDDVLNSVMPKGSAASATKNLTPEEKQAKQAARERAQRIKKISRKGRFATLSVRRLGRVAGNIIRQGMANRYTAQINDANRLGDTRQAHLLQQQRLRSTAMMSQIMSHSTFGLRAVAGVLTSKPMGAVMTTAFLVNIAAHFNNINTQFNEQMRQYHNNSFDQYKQSEYMRTRLVYNTFGTRGIF